MLVTTLLVMAKAPVAGLVKTRLCPPLTFQQAADVAAAALSDTLGAALGCGADRVLVALDGAPGGWLPAGVEVVPQVGAGFAARLDRAWADAGGPTLQIGMDTPQVTSSLLDAGLAALDRHAGALGMALDGGWWGLALRRPLKGAFAGIEMSTARTGAQQLARLIELGVDPILLPPMTDIDAIADLDAVVALMGSGSRTASVHAGLVVA